MDLGLTLFSGFTRAFLDTIEKHLFEFDYLNPFKVIMIEGFICVIFSLFFYLYYLIFKNESFHFYKDDVNIIYLIILLILYFILSGLKNIYIMITIKLYSPMTRALTETIFDQFILLYYFIQDANHSIINWTYYIINFICLIIIVFCSLVYNDFIVLYCCGLERNTYKEIRKRSLIYNINDMLEENNSDDNNSEDDDIKELNDKKNLNTIILLRIYNNI